MATVLRRNLINGDWVEGSDETENINPSDCSDVVGYFSRASMHSLSAPKIGSGSMLIRKERGGKARLRDPLHMGF